MPDTMPVLTTLNRIVSGGEGSFTIVVADADKNYYAQFVPAGGGLYAELSGNAVLEPADRLTPAQQQALRARGWESDGHENWSREWPDASTPALQQQIALEALTALHDVYGAHGPITVEENLEGRGFAAGGSALAKTLGLGIALFVVIGLLLFLFLAA